MIWLSLAFLSALLLGIYDVCKKQALSSNAVMPVLLVNTTLCALLSCAYTLCTDSSALLPQDSGQPMQSFAPVVLKAVLVLSSWICGYYAIKHLPITIVGPVNASRPVMVLVGAVALYGESLNAWQWAGVTLAIVAFYLLKRSSNREGIRWTHNRWIVLLILAALLGAASGLYDKLLLSPDGLHLHRLFVQTWFNSFQALLMALLVAILWWPRRRQDRFHWHPAIIGVSLFLTAADMVYFYALSHPDAMISIVSMVRRSSVLVSFAYGAFILHEHNLRAKLFDLLLLLLSLVCLAMGA